VRRQPPLSTTAQERLVQARRPARADVQVLESRLVLAAQQSKGPTAGRDDQADVSPSERTVRTAYIAASLLRWFCVNWARSRVGAAAAGAPTSEVIHPVLVKLRLRGPGRRLCIRPASAVL
jgi:hypothetical protein